MPNILSKLNNIKSFITENLHHISLALFIFGFVTDYFTLPNITNILAIYIGLTYLLLIALIIYLRELINTERINYKNEKKHAYLLTLAVTFLLGSYTSFVFVYYIRSSDIIASFPILILILSLMLSNELVRSKNRIYVELITYSLATIFFFIFAVPFVVKLINIFTFTTSLSLSLIFLYSYIAYLDKLNPNLIYIKLHKFLALPILIMLLFYILNIFPSAPLALRDAGLYKYISSESSSTGKQYNLQSHLNRNYLLQYSFKETDLNDNIYYYTEIQAPDGLKGNVSHIWYKYNNSVGDWVQIAKINYPLTGGRSDGYRGYSNVNLRGPGKYKISVMLEDKRLIGSLRFKVK